MFECHTATPETPDACASFGVASLHEQRHCCSCHPAGGMLPETESQRISATAAGVGSITGQAPRVSG